MIIAGTGHRPKYLPCGYNENYPWCVSLKETLKDELIRANPAIVITGGALGWDMWLAEVAIDLGIPNILYLPFLNTGQNWPKHSRERLLDIRDKSAEVHFTSDVYKGPETFYTRDEAMVDEADEVWALWNPVVQTGGTFYTVEYARDQNKPIKNFWG
jgi:uncharacterized phage-like protein YoqJ